MLHLRWSNVRAKRETRNSKSTASKESSVAKMVGERLNKRAASKPDDLLATTPKKSRTTPMRKATLGLHPQIRRIRQRMREEKKARKATHAMNVVGKKRRKEQAKPGGK